MARSRYKAGGATAGRFKPKKMGKADFRYAVSDFYLTNPIARASQLMGELAANAKARANASMAAE